MHVHYQGVIRKLPVEWQLCLPPKGAEVLRYRFGVLVLLFSFSFDRHLIILQVLILLNMVEMFNSLHPMILEASFHTNASNPLVSLIAFSLDFNLTERGTFFASLCNTLGSYTQPTDVWFDLRGQNRGNLINSETLVRALFLMAAKNNPNKPWKELCGQLFHPEGITSDTPLQSFIKSQATMWQSWGPV